MIERILAFSTRQRLLVVLGALILGALGVTAFQSLPIDAVPDVTNNQVQINVAAPGLAPAEVEKLVTYPVEVAVGGVPYVTATRSLSQPGLSQVTVVFDDAVSIYFARQLLLERLTSLQGSLPAGVGTPQMSPISTGLGEIYQYTLDSDTTSLADLRTLQEFLVKPQLRTVPGVAEVNTYGGYEKQYQIEIDPQRMLPHDVSLAQVEGAVSRNNRNAGGGFIVQGGQQLLVRGVGLVTGVGDIGGIVVSAEGGTPVYVRDVARVREGNGPRQSAALHDGKETVLGVAMMLKGANSRTVALAVDERLREIRRQLPPGVRLTTVYNRTDLVDQTIHTVERNLVEGGALVIAVLLLLLGNVRGALIVACVIPLSLLFAIIGMNQFGISANLLSLGAIDFGMIVDGSVVLVENTVRRLGEARHRAGRVLSRQEVTAAVLASAHEVGAPLTFGVAIIILVYLPIMTLTGIEGKMFRPMAYTVALALGGALLLSLTLIPALCAMGLSGDTREKDNWFMRGAERLYGPLLAWALARRRLVVGSSALFFVGCAALFPMLGSEFTPKLDEGAISITPTRMAGVSVDESVRIIAPMEHVIRSFPEVRDVYDRLGTAEVANDPMPPSSGDCLITLKDRGQWPRGMTKERLVADMAERLNREAPGQGYSFSQPIEDRTSELIAGVKADVAVKVFGPDTATLSDLGHRLLSAMQKVPGAADVTLQQSDGLPTLEIAVDRDAVARYGINVGDVQDVIESCVGGRTLGQVVEADRRFDIVLKLPEAQRNDIEVIRRLQVSAPGGQRIPLGSLAHIAIRSSPAQINREQGQRLVILQANVRGRDLGSFVADAQARAVREVPLPSGYHLEWGGQFENLQRAQARLLIVVPAALALIFLLLFMTFGSVKQAAIIFTGVPLAVTGGILALLLRHLPFSISAGVGFIALFGVAVLNGVVLVSAINRLREEGAGLREAVTEGARTRLRPVLMTALVASLGFVPMALSTGVGAEVQRPLATVVIGGIVSSTLLTLIVLPTLYAWLEATPTRLRESRVEGARP